MYYFHPENWGRFPIWRYNIFQMGWWKTTNQKSSYLSIIFSRDPCNGFLWSLHNCGGFWPKFTTFIWEFHPRWWWFRFREFSPKNVGCTKTKPLIQDASGEWRFFRRGSLLFHMKKLVMTVFPGWGKQKRSKFNHSKYKNMTSKEINQVHSLKLTAKAPKNGWLE